jgi:hypothetical protein
LPTQCFAVDTWRGDEHTGSYPDAVYEELRAFHDSRYAAFSRLLRMEFDAARPQFAPGSVDLLHIDGFHTYEAVRHDFEVWVETLSDRSVVLFHDILVRHGDFGVWRLWEELTQRYEHFEFPHVHGLGVLLVGKQLPPSLRQFAESARQPDFIELFDVLGSRGTLHQANLRQDERLRLQQQELNRVSALAAAQEAELEQYRYVAQERQAHLDHWVSRAQQLNNEVERLKGQLDHYQQAHYRLLDQFNRLLRKTGPLHRATKAAAEWSVSQADRWRKSSSPHGSIRPPAP